VRGRNGGKRMYHQFTAQKKTLTVNTQPPWSSRCVESTKKEKRMIEKKYGIRIGQTEIYCVRCGKAWGFGNHTCQDIRLENLKIKKDEKISELKKTEDKALLILSNLGPQKAAILLMIPERTVTNWIQRKNVPKRHIEKVLNL
jgi:hypothetical protein